MLRKNCNQHSVPIPLRRSLQVSTLRHPVSYGVQVSWNASAIYNDGPYPCINVPTRSYFARVIPVSKGPKKCKRRPLGNFVKVDHNARRLGPPLMNGSPHICPRHAAVKRSRPSGSKSVTISASLRTDRRKAADQFL